MIDQIITLAGLATILSQYLVLVLKQVCSSMTTVVMTCPFHAKVSVIAKCVTRIILPLQMPTEWPPLTYYRSHFLSSALALSPSASIQASHFCLWDLQASLILYKTSRINAGKISLKAKTAQLVLVNIWPNNMATSFISEPLYSMLSMPTCKWFILLIHSHGIWTSWRWLHIWSSFHVKHSKHCECA